MFVPVVTGWAWINGGGCFSGYPKTGPWLGGSGLLRDKGGRPGVTGEETGHSNLVLHPTARARRARRSTSQSGAGRG